MFEVIFSVLALVAVAGALLAAAARLAARKLGIANRAFEMVAPVLFPLACLVAVVAMAGSLYFSEVADYEPCRLCWFQRIAMYPLAAILLIALIRRDWGARWYAIPIAVIGAGISTYHYYIEWNPQTDTCSYPLPCTYVWFRRFGFVSLSFMALCGFVAIVMLLVCAPRSRAPRTTDPGEAMS